MRRNELLLQQLEHSWDKEDWYPPLADALKGVTAAQADWKPEGSAVNTIWQNVNHLIFYKERFLKRWTGEETEYPAGVTNDDTFKVEATGDADWQETLARLDLVQRGIREKLSALGGEAELDAAMTDRNLEEWLYCLIRHDAYHSGEIIMLRKLQGSWPARRSFE